jgi:hypothetical protein
MTMSLPAPDIDFLIYEEHSPYRREFLGRASSARKAAADAAGFSLRTGLAVSVRQRRAGSGSSTMVETYRAGKRIFGDGAATEGSLT